MEPGSADELELRDYLRVIRRRKWTIALTAVVIVGAALTAAFLKTPRYRASAELLIAPKVSETLFNPNNGSIYTDPRRAVATEIKVLSSKAVEDAVAEKLGSRPTISATGSPDDDVVTVRAVSVDPERAALIVNTYATEYIDYRRESTVRDILDAQAEIQRKVEEKQGEIDALDAQPGPKDSPARAAERTSLTNQQNLFRAQLDQLQVGASLNSGGAQLITPAEAPDEPFEPNPVRSGITALAIGLLLGVGLAFLFEYLDDALRTTVDVERATQGLPVLGVIPAVPGWRNQKTTRTVTRSEPNSMAAEAYRSLRTSVQFLGLDSPLHTLQLTSPSSSEGKTTTVANLAVALADAGQRVIVVDCDLRRSRLHEFFGLANTVGITSVLVGDVPLSAALQQAGTDDRLRVLCSGPRPPNPSELLSGQRAIEVLNAIRAEADIVLFDSPPVLPVSDAVVLAARVDATLLVAHVRSTSKKALLRAYEQLRQVDAPVIGTLLNGASGDDGDLYSYGYGYGAYGTETRKATIPTGAARR
ncbi:MAG: polysaccharide biosynthesis tyrosine autokinase [Acidimicrobiales bacterium]